MTVDQIANIFTYHKALPGQRAKQDAIREEAKELAILINASCPESREKALALTHIQQAAMFANAAISIHEKDPNAAD